MDRHSQAPHQESACSETHVVQVRLRPIAIVKCPVDPKASVDARLVQDHRPMANLSGISKDTLVGKLLRAPLRLIPRSAVLPILQGPLRGRKWTVGSGTHGCWLGSYEHEKQEALRRALRPGDVMYDVGANVGFYSLLASALVGKTGCVCSFEPSPSNIEMLKRHLAINRITNCLLFEAAVGAVDDESGFDPSSDPHTGHLAESGSIRVQVVTLDRLVSEKKAPAPSVIKVDVEGAEEDCLRGASRTIQNFRPTIFLATHGPRLHAACCLLLRKWNYQLMSLNRRNVEETDELIARPIR
jgi:FkbM family methyltransferase